MSVNYDLKVGFARLDVTPPLGSNITGYFHQRLADGILDPLEVNAIAINDSQKTVLVIVVDSLYVRTDFTKIALENISKATGIDKTAIFMHATHTHTGGDLSAPDNLTLDADKDYANLALRKFTDVAVLALEDMKPAKMGIALTKAENIGYNRRYLMKDGSTQTNPGVNNPDIVKSIGLLDERMNVVRFLRADGSSVVFANYGNHPDTIGGNKISADWPGISRRLFEKAVDNCKCVVLNGAQGDINHINIHPIGGENNDLVNDFDNVPRGYGHSIHMAQVVVGAIMQVYSKVTYMPVSQIKHAVKIVNVPTNMPKPEDMEQAYYIDKMHKEGRDAELPYKGMLLTTFVAEAERMIRLEHGPNAIPIRISALSIGNVAMIGVPGEPFTGIGMGLKEAKGWDMIMPCCLVNGDEGYFPMQDSYDEGGYEARSSIFKSGVAELLIKEGKDLLDSMIK